MSAKLYGPSTEWEQITPSDTNFTRPVRAVKVDVEGDLDMTTQSGVETTGFLALSGVVYPMSPLRIRATSTATGVWVLY